MEYFADGHGRAEPIRFLLYHAGVDFDDSLLTQEEWVERKQFSDNVGEFGKLPLLTAKGRPLGQSMSILRSLGIKHGYYSPDDWKLAYHTDVIVDCWVDVFESIAKVLFGMPDATEEEKAEAITNAIQNVHIPTM